VAVAVKHLQPEVPDKFKMERKEIYEILILKIYLKK
jgi:hypothetical protein